MLTVHGGQWYDDSVTVCQPAGAQVDCVSIQRLDKVWSLVCTNCRRGGRGRGRAHPPCDLNAFSKCGAALGLTLSALRDDVLGTALHTLAEHHRDLVHHHHPDLGPLGRRPCRGRGHRGGTAGVGAVGGLTGPSRILMCIQLHSLSKEKGMVHLASFLMMSFCRLGTNWTDKEGTLGQATTVVRVQCAGAYRL